MSPGIRATVAFDQPGECPVAELSNIEGTSVDSVHSNICPAAEGNSIIEFTVGAPEGVDLDRSPLFTHGTSERYRMSLDGRDCPCQCLGEFSCPVTRYAAENGTLTLVFYAADFDELQAIVSELRERHPSVDIKRFIRSPAAASPEDTVYVDRSKLTDRQLEVLRTAEEMGYFDRPRRANATRIAEELDIHPSTFQEHLVAAQSKLLEDIL